MDIEELRVLIDWIPELIEMKDGQGRWLAVEYKGPRPVHQLIDRRSDISV